MRYDTHMNAEDYIGFYSFRDEPCRIYKDEATGMVRAQRYYGGTGFVDILVSDVMWRGRKITEESFKKMVMQVMGRNSD